MRRLFDTVRSPRRQWALLRALFDLCHVELALRRHSLQIICTNWNLELLQAPGELHEPQSLVTGSAGLPDVDVWALTALARRWPLRGGCLRYALAAGRRLSRRGAPGHLILGARISLQGDIEAHAWLFHGGVRLELPALQRSHALAAVSAATRPFEPLQRVKGP
jgi:hypothetical protein